MKKITFYFLCFSCIACTDKSLNNITNLSLNTFLNEDSLAMLAFYAENKSNELPSRNIGTVGNGKLENASLMPFYGSNFNYFDQDSYLAKRAFTSKIVKTIILNTYDDLKLTVPNRKFFLMELSNIHGGEMSPHRTHQNGLSVDFMMPKTKNGIANYELDTLGKDHYFLTFNDDGTYHDDKSIKIDFDLIAKHILCLHENAKKVGYKIAKVIIKTEYKNALFNTPNGKLLKQSDIYVVKNLSPIVNAIHDDHFHVDFEKK
ncbi:hypothetical protein DNU06_15620 [Putridiphycobacter roseus]|uniref:Replication initiation protein n=1 Tax=Putridiphycobacter roseus TaxID=2219161 RepID=A0A2W1N9J4_9FLAO|nr:penicillin-insensitive murein endopeptidase [Putridiphycobacter roseus]PZE15935.1 hypothetical protein DNU06_15620 [Putridiphycobacter roseus]